MTLENLDYKKYKKYKLKYKKLTGGGDDIMLYSNEYNINDLYRQWNVDPMKTVSIKQSITENNKEYLVESKDKIINNDKILKFTGVDGTIHVLGYNLGILYECVKSVDKLILKEKFHLKDIPKYNNETLLYIEGNQLKIKLNKEVYTLNVVDNFQQFFSCFEASLNSKCCRNIILKSELNDSESDNCQIKKISHISTYGDMEQGINNRENPNSFVSESGILNGKIHVISSKLKGAYEKYTYYNSNIDYITIKVNESSDGPIIKSTSRFEECKEMLRFIGKTGKEIIITLDGIIYECVKSGSVIKLVEKIDLKKNQSSNDKNYDNGVVAYPSNNTIALDIGFDTYKMHPDNVKFIISNSKGKDKRKEGILYIHFWSYMSTLNSTLGWFSRKNYGVKVNIKYLEAISKLYKLEDPEDVFGMLDISNDSRIVGKLKYPVKTNMINIVSNVENNYDGDNIFNYTCVKVEGISKKFYYLPTSNFKKYDKFLRFIGTNKENLFMAIDGSIYNYIELSKTPTILQIKFKFNLKDYILAGNKLKFNYSKDNSNDLTLRFSNQENIQYSLNTDGKKHIKNNFTVTWFVAAINNLLFDRSGEYYKNTNDKDIVTKNVIVKGLNYSDYIVKYGKGAM